MIIPPRLLIHSFFFICTQISFQLSMNVFLVTAKFSFFTLTLPSPIKGVRVNGDFTLTPALSPKGEEGKTEAA